MSKKEPNSQTNTGNPPASGEYRPGLEGVVATRSAVSFVDGDRGELEYRGINIRDLAAHSTYEETVYLLLHNHLPSPHELSRFTALMAGQRSLPYSVRDAIANFPATIHPMIALQAGITLLASEETNPEVSTSLIHNIRRAASVIAKAPMILAAYERHRHGEEALPPAAKYTHAENLLFMVTGERPHPDEAYVFDKLMVLHADLTTNASTFACRVVGSTLANIYSSVSAALGALSGALHGGTNERVLRMLFSIGSPDNVERFVEEMIATNTRILGIGHRLYRVKDPRAELLQQLIPRLLKHKGGEEMKILYQTALRLEEVVSQKLGDQGLFPTVDFYSGIVLDMLKIPVDLFKSIFAVSRIAGWCAHWVEQVSVNRIFSPKEEYIGDHQRPYVPLEQR